MPRAVPTEVLDTTSAQISSPSVLQARVSRTILALIIVSAVLGPYLSLDIEAGSRYFAFRVIVLATALPAVAILLARKRLSRTVVIYLVFMYSFATFGLLSLLWSPTPGDGLREVVSALCAMGGGLVVIALTPTTRRPMVAISGAWILGLAASAAIAVWEIQTGGLLGASSRLPAGIAVPPHSTFGNSNDFAAFLLFSLAIVMGALVQSPGVLRKLVFIATIAGCLFLLAETGSRTGILGTLVVAAAYVTRYRTTRGSPWKTGLIWIFIVVATLMIALNRTPMFVREFFSPIFVERSSVFVQVTQDQVREGLTVTGLQYFADSGMAGQGAGSFEYLAARDSMASTFAGLTNPHNLLVELLAQYGILVGAVFVILLVATGSSLWRRSVLTDAAHAASGLAALCALILGSFVSSSVLEQSWWWTALGSVVAIASMGKETSSGPTRSGVRAHVRVAH